MAACGTCDRSRWVAAHRTAGVAAHRVDRRRDLPPPSGRRTRGGGTLHPDRPYGCDLPPPSGRTPAGRRAGIRSRKRGPACRREQRVPAAVVPRPDARGVVRPAERPIGVLEDRDRAVDDVAGGVAAAHEALPCRLADRAAGPRTRRGAFSCSSPSYSWRAVVPTSQRSASAITTPSSSASGHCGSTSMSQTTWSSRSSDSHSDSAPPSTSGRAARSRRLPGRRDLEIASSSRA